MRRSRVEVTSGFLLVLAWLYYRDTQNLLPLGLAACAVHELGHWIVLRLLGGRVARLRLTAVGAEMVLERPLGYWQEGLVALAGPGASLLLAVLFSLREEGLVFSGLNLAVGCFNLLPLGPLDGGRALSCTLGLLAGPENVERVSGALRGGLGALLLAAGLGLAWSCGNLTLLLVAIWLQIAEKRQKLSLPFGL